jgi:hypothetical protein
MARFSSPLPEARIIDTNHVLIALSPSDDVGGLDGFYGAVITDPSAGLPDLSGKAVYLPIRIALAARRRRAGTRPRAWGRMRENREP